METNEMIQVLMGHRSVRKLKSDPVPEEVIKTIIRCGQMAPTSSHFQAYSIIDIRDTEKKKALCASAGGQEWLVNAPITLLFCADLHRNSEYLKTEDPDILHNTEAYTVACVDAALAAQKTMIAAQCLGLGGVVVGGVRNDMNLMKNLFDLPSLVMPLFVLTLGYYDEVPLQRPRLPYDVVVKKDRYTEDGDAEKIAAYDEEVRRFFLENSGGVQNFSWRESCSYSLGLKPRYEVTDFVREQGFLQK
ncbi:MAG: nitroreductase family protein [Clostridia bacterium]|nr:nitroreductase family protein [Clostridia bacterium]